MIFKSINAYKITGLLVGEDVINGVKSNLFSPCKFGQTTSGGWISPIGDHYEHPVHSALNRDILCYKQESVKVPKSVVMEELGRRITKALHDDKNATYADFTKKIRKSMMAEIECEFLRGETVKCFTKSSRTYGYIDYTKGMVIVETTSAKKAEEFVLHILRLVPGKGIRLTPLKTVHEPCRQMSNWLTTGQMPGEITRSDSVKLKDFASDGSIKYSKHEINDEKIQAYLNEEKTVSELKLNWIYNNDIESYVSFVMTEDFVFKSVKLSSALAGKEDANKVGEEVSDFDTTFCLMTGVFSGLIDYVIESFGGEHVEESNE